MIRSNACSPLNIIALSVFWVFSELAGSWHCDLISLADLLNQQPEINYLHCYDPIPFEYQKLSIVDDHYLHPYEGAFKESFILNIPHGQVLGQAGDVLVNDHLIYELVWQNCFLHRQTLLNAKNNPVITVHGKVAVISLFGYMFYYHWLVEALGRLALLEMHGVEYDYLYVPLGRPFLKETLALWGIDPAKIIEASDSQILQADELIVASQVASVSVGGAPRLVHYMPEYLVKYIKDKLMASVDLSSQSSQLSKKIFISRKDAGARRMLNEDDVFMLFEEQGFERYLLSSLSVAQQIQLFHNADIIVAPLGSGSANVLFCKQGARIIEIFQARRDCTIYYLCQTLGLSYSCIKTMDFIDENDGQYDMAIDLDVIREFINKLQKD